MSLIIISLLLISTILPHNKGQDLQCAKGVNCNPVYLFNLSVIENACSYENLVFRNLNETVIQVGAFRHCYRARLIDLSNNNIRFIKAGAFLDIPRLQELYLSNNDLDFFEPGTFHTLNVLDVLVITGNKIKTFPKYEIRSKKIRYLSLKNNEFEYLPESVTQKFLTTDLLDLSFNKFVGFHPRAFYNLEPGFMMILNHNNLNSLALFFNDTIYMNLSQLQAIGNVLESLSDEILGEFYKRNIISMDFSFNLISTIQEKVFSKYKLLRTLYLSHNRVRFVLKNTFANLNDLTMLDLSYNILSNSIFEIKLPAALSYLNYSHNQINALMDFSFVAHYSKRISFINLDYNQLTYFDSNNFCSHIQRISINHNNWLCSHLYSILKNLRRRNVQVDYAYDFNDYNINGISCRPDYLWVKETAATDKSLWKRYPNETLRFNTTPPNIAYTENFPSKHEIINTNKNNNVLSTSKPNTDPTANVGVKTGDKKKCQPIPMFPNDGTKISIEFVIPLSIWSLLFSIAI